VVKKELILCMLLSVIFFILPVSYASQRIAVVDMRRVFREAKIAQNLAKDFFKDVQSKRRELKAKEDELKKKERELKKKAKILSKKEREKEFEKLREEAKQLKHMKVDIEDELRTKRQEIRAKIMKHVRKVISAYAKRYNYVIILPKGILLYSQDAVDITDKIIKELNRGKKKK